HSQYKEKNWPSISFLNEIISVNNKHKGVHKYFDYKPSEWNIIEFLKECEVEPFDRKIDHYTKDLENIANFETGGRRERAQILLDNYREASRTVTRHRWLARLSVAQYSDIPSGLRWLARLPDVQRLIADLMGWLMKGEFYITKAWDSGRPYNQIHCHQPTFMDGGTINAVVNGAITGGTFISESSDKRSQEKEDEQKQTKRVRFHEEKPPSKKKSKSGKRGTLPDGTKITKPSPINYVVE
ncbi:4092_t:CDS:2, partial [Rhizophagus irregularis]